METALIIKEPAKYNKLRLPLNLKILTSTPNDVDKYLNHLIQAYELTNCYDATD